LEDKLLKIPLDEDKFGYQLVVNDQEEIIDQMEFLLINSIDADLDEIYQKVHSLNGLFVPAHINKGANSLISQLGFVPPDIKADAMEISRHVTKTNFIKKNAYLKKFQFIQDSDAHYINDIGSVYCNLIMENLSFDEFRLAIRGEQGRYIETIIE
ncbi:MAG: histidinol-phosphatase, partial [Bacteroidales bacterium]|nr:histidinol-phosphatase [Bacteroidales bacterium]